ncbi:replication endonuclease [Proteus mirabilis]|nr:replication endonuclease [Proteus mirabilis]
MTTAIDKNSDGLKLKHRYKFPKYPFKYPSPVVCAVGEFPRSDKNEKLYLWNEGKGKAIYRPFETYEQIHQKEREHKAFHDAEALLSKQPKLVQIVVNKRYSDLDKEQGRKRANAYLAKTFVERTYPRIKMITDRYALPAMTVENCNFFNRFNRLPDMSKKDIENLAWDIANLMNEQLMLVGKENITDSELKLTYKLFLHASKITSGFKQDVPRWAKLTTRYFNQKDADSAISRMMSDKWWLNRLRKYASQWREHLSIAINLVSKKANIYASKTAINEWKEQKNRTREFLKSMELEDEEGNRVSLIDKYYGSVANPAIKRTEMMVRIRGFEDICNELGYVGEFYTLTAPSKYHATTKHGYRNRKWNGCSPADTQKYLCKLWSKIRAKLHRKNLRVFGMRVAEPHHDGTPHWHMLLFMLPSQLEEIRSIIKAYTVAEDNHELITDKARKARFYVEEIDPEKGSATGYVAKYISKNVDGYALDGEVDDESGRPMKEAAMAAAAWSGRWNIRQFQFIGGAPVTVYRELRRMADHDRAMGLDVEFALVHDCADSGNWAGYINAQGGPFVKRENLIARLWYQESEDTNEYGEEVIRVKGVFSTLVGIDTPILTRLKQWKIVKKLDDAHAESAFSGANASPRSSVNNCTGETRTINDEEKGVTEILDNFRSIGHEITLEDAQKMRNGSGIVIDDIAFRCFDDGSLIRTGTTQLKYRQFHERKARIFNKVNKLRGINV